MQSIAREDLALYTDFYQLTMAQGYYHSGQYRQRAQFDYFFRRLPFDGGYAVFAGLKDVAEVLADLHFQPQHLDYLASQGLSAEFLAYLKGFRFTGTIRAAREGELVFPFAPVATIEAPLIEAQVIETFLLNWLNFSTLIATKAARIRAAAGPDKVLIDMGLRRAQGFGSLVAATASQIGGFNATSNVLAGFLNGIPIAGTHAHAWVQSFGDELLAFRTFAEQFPTNCTLLVDTYDTLASGVPNAITVAKEMEARGQRMNAIRLDSGDLAYLSKRARAMLDDAGLPYVKIVASNDLDEYVIQSLHLQGACIDVYGVGTKLATADGSPALGGVYKLVSIGGQPRIKVSDNLIKITLPGTKHAVRYLDADGQFVADGLYLDGHPAPEHLFHPHAPEKNTSVRGLAHEPLLAPVVQDGQLTGPLPPTAEAARYCAQRLRQLPVEHQRFENPHIYRVGISPELLALRNELLDKARGKTAQW